MGPYVSEKLTSSIFRPKNVGIVFLWNVGTRVTSVYHHRHLCRRVRASDLTENVCVSARARLCSCYNVLRLHKGQILLIFKLLTNFWCSLFNHTLCFTAPLRQCRCCTACHSSPLHHQSAPPPPRQNLLTMQWTAFFIHPSVCCCQLKTRNKSLALFHVPSGQLPWKTQ